jgi:hypothetical protein
MYIFKLKHGTHVIYVENDLSNDIDSDYVYIKENKTSNSYLITKDYLNRYYERVK